jgi:arylsulfatase A-like enzyme
MRNLLPFIGVVLLIGATPNLYAADAPGARPPNIVHIIGDDVGYDDLSCYGAPKIKTPNLDRLAAQGMRFTSFYAPSAICTPTRAALMTGCYAQRVGLQRVLFPNDNIGLSDSEITIAELLKTRGYATECIGKWHLGHAPQFLPTRHGFDSYLGIPYPNDHGPERQNSNKQTAPFPPIPLIRDDKIIEQPADLAKLPDQFVDEAVKFMTANKDRPFFLHLANIETHTPWFTPERFHEKSGDTAFGDAVVCMDWMVGQVMTTLDQLGLSDNTIVVFTSDNGPLWQRGPELEKIYGKYGTVDTTRPHLLRAGKYQARWEGGTRVPAIVRWPGKIKSGTATDEIAAGFDLFATFASAAGAKVPEDRIIDGKDLTPLLTGATDKSPRDTFYYYGGFTLNAVRQGDYKLILPGRPPPDVDKTLLFDVRRDPGEKKDFAAEHPEIVQQLMKVVEQARDDLGDAGTNNPGKHRRPHAEQ